MVRDARYIIPPFAVAERAVREPPDPTESSWKVPSLVRPSVSSRNVSSVGRT